jgi:HSP20 family protein
MTLKADVPGMDKSNFNIRVTGDVLEIECHREEEKSSGDALNRVRERRWGKAIRSMRLPDNIDIQGIKSEYKDGVLCLHLPKTRLEPSNVKRIEIQ